MKSADSGFYEFRRQLEYKAQWYGSKVTVIDRWYPSSQLCSGCGNRQPMPLKIRQYDCSNCGLALDRDLNAAINIRDYSEAENQGKNGENNSSQAFSGGSFPPKDAAFIAAL